MKTVTVNVNAKVNLSLNITGVKNGYHELDMIAASAGLTDVVSVCENDRVDVEFVGDCLDAKKTNAYRAAEYICEKYSLPGVKAKIKTNIPFGCGLGSSSADCAGMIKALNILYSLNLGRSETEEIARLFGSDTPYMLNGGYARLKGCGEIIERFESSFSAPILIAYKGSVGAKESFEKFDKSGVNGIVADNDALKRALRLCDFDAIAENLANALTLPSIEINRFIADILDLSKDYRRVMTGSGAAVVIFGYDRQLIEKLTAFGANLIETELLPSSETYLR